MIVPERPERAPLAPAASRGLGRDLFSGAGSTLVFAFSLPLIVLVSALTAC